MKSFHPAASFIFGAILSIGGFWIAFLSMKSGYMDGYVLVNGAVSTGEMARGWATIFALFGFVMAAFGVVAIRRAMIPPPRRRRPRGFRPGTLPEGPRIDHRHRSTPVF